MIKVAIFGGSFDPPHKGHQEIVAKALEQLDIDKLLIVPAYLNPFKSNSLAPADLRLSWCHALFDSIPRVEVIEYEIEQNRAVFTSQTLEELRKFYKIEYIIIGSDTIEKIAKWHRFDWINAHFKWVVVTREGYIILHNPLRDVTLLEVDVPISSSTIREFSQLDLVDLRIRQEVKEILNNRKIDDIR